MEIKKTIESKEGNVEVHADFNPEEVSFIMEVGISTLLAAGAFPFIKQSTVDAGQVIEQVAHG